MDIKKNIYPDLARHGFGISHETSTVRIGELTYESPIHLWENSSLYGPCSIGAYLYFSQRLSPYNSYGASLKMGLIQITSSPYFAQAIQNFLANVNARAVIIKYPL